MNRKGLDPQVTMSKQEEKTKNIKNEPFVGAHFFAFDVRSARISPRRPFAKRSAGPAD